eukprot:m.78917 g.78917  ORF g.78917 m.78917 type:complete len:119 (+) comp36118_c0_seq3:1096-1452(+)
MEAIGNRLVTVGNDRTLTVFTLINFEKMATQRVCSHSGLITGLYLDGFRVLTCSTDFSIRVFKWELSEDGNDWRLAKTYGLLGGSVKQNPEGFSKVVCDNGHVFGISGKIVKAYNFEG